MKLPPKKNSRAGVALLLVMISLALMAVIIVEILAASRVDLRVALNARNRAQAYYMALSSARLQMLRMHMYKDARNLGSAGGVTLPPQLIDLIWSQPVPPLPLPGGKSKWPGEFSAKIESESSKIAINLLDGNKNRYSNDAKAKEVANQITRLIEGLLENEEFDALYRGLEPKDLVHPLIDWVDTNEDQVEGGDEARDYERLDPPYRPRNDRMPSISELHLVRGWTDDLVNRLAGNFTVIGTDTKVNPNYVSLLRIQSWGPKLSQEDLGIIDLRRRLQPFQSLAEMESFIQTDAEIKNGRDFQLPDDLKMGTRETAFRIEATGQVGDARRSIRLFVLIPEEIVQVKCQNNDPCDKDGDGLDDKSGDPMPTPSKPAKDGKLKEPQVVLSEEFL
jgi:general secretion pathway protein K